MNITYTRKYYSLSNYSILIPNTSKYLIFHIKISDKRGNILTTIPHYINVIDNKKPILELFYVNGAKIEKEYIKFKVTALDNINVRKVYLQYSSVDYVIKEMVNYNNIYEIRIPLNQLKEYYVKYFFMVTDSNNNSLTSSTFIIFLNNNSYTQKDYITSINNSYNLEQNRTSQNNSNNNQNINYNNFIIINWIIIQNIHKKN